MSLQPQGKLPQALAFMNDQIIKNGLKPLNKYQIEVLTDPHRYKTIVWHRRAGKTVMSLIEIFRQSQLRVGTYWIVFPFLDEARDAVWNNMIFSVIPREFIERTNEVRMAIKFTNGSYFRIKGADNPRTLRGPNVCGVIFDEFGQQKPEAWKVVQPIINENKGWAWFVSTPVGKNHFYDMYRRGYSPKFSQWKSWYLRASDSKILTEEELEDALQDIGPEYFKQEYECAWIEGAGQVFRGVNEVITAKPSEPLENALYVIGCDIAKKQDYTVITVFDRRTNQQVFQERFRRVDWPEQRKRIFEVSKHYNGAMVMLDQSGVGDPFLDELQRMGCPATGLVITQPIKRMMVDKLSNWIENKYLRILPIKETTDELGDYSYKLGPTGKYTYSAPAGRHDDIVMSLALAIWELNPVLTKETESKPPNWLQTYKQRAISNMHGNDEEYFENLADWERL